MKATRYRRRSRRYLTDEARSALVRWFSLKEFGFWTLFGFVGLGYLALHVLDYWISTAG